MGKSKRFPIFYYYLIKIRMPACATLIGLHYFSGGMGVWGYGGMIPLSQSFYTEPDSSSMTMVRMIEERERKGGIGAGQADTVEAWTRNDDADEFGGRSHYSNHQQSSTAITRQSHLFRLIRKSSPSRRSDSTMLEHLPQSLLWIE